MTDLLGLDEPALRVYRVLLSHPESQDLTRPTGLGRAEVRRALTTLATLGLVQSTPGGSYDALPPTADLADTIVAAEQRLSDRWRAIEAARRMIAALSSEYAAARPREPAVRVASASAARLRMLQLTREVCDELLVIDPHPHEDDGPLQPSLDVLDRAVAAGARLRLLRSHPTVVPREVDLRTGPLVPIPLIVVDRAIALLGHEADGEVLEVRAPALVQALTALFECCWTESAPVPDARTALELDARERTLLRLLATGQTDEAASRRLGVSLRTVRRTMAVLMRRLGATSRFEAGVRAVQRGWL